MKIKTLKPILLAAALTGGFFMQVTFAAATKLDANAASWFQPGQQNSIATYLNTKFQGREGGGSHKICSFKVENNGKVTLTRTGNGSAQASIVLWVGLNAINKPTLVSESQKSTVKGFGADYNAAITEVVVSDQNLEKNLHNLGCR